MSQDFKLFIPIISVECTECPDLLMIDAVKKTAYDFCYRTQAWVLQLDPMSISVNTSIYDLDVPIGSVCAHVLSVVYNGVKLNAVTREQLDVTHPTWYTDTGTPTSYFRPNMGQIQFDRLPTIALTSGVQARVALAPDRVLGTNIDDDIFYRYAAVIILGAKARLMAIPKRKWTDMNMSKYYDQQYQQETSNARAAAYADHNSAQLRVTGRPFA